MVNRGKDIPQYVLLPIGVIISLFIDTNLIKAEFQLLQIEHLLYF